MKQFLKTLKGAVVLTVLMAVLSSVIYPAVTTVLAQTVFKEKADGKAVGSEVVGQQWSNPRFFKGRPSSVNYNVYTDEEKADGTYTGVASGTYNYGPSNEALKERVETAVTEFKAEYKKATGEELTEEIPTDLLTASGSGLDPHISPASAKIQVPIVAANTGFEEEELYQMVEAHTEHKALGIFGEERVNVLKLNLDLARKLGVTA
jgi:potassium-transporting ATPase KdpC subunit